MPWEAMVNIAIYAFCNKTLVILALIRAIVILGLCYVFFCKSHHEYLPRR